MSKKQRFCPAVQREITPAECGEHRNSEYRCPASCQFNPFAPENYSQALEAEGRIDELSMRFLSTEPGHSSRMARLAQKIPPSDEVAFNAFAAYELFLRRDDQGLTCMQRWEKLGFPDLKNDLRCLLRYKMTTTVRLMEVQRVIDTEQVEFLDLLQPERGPLVVRDRNTASRACRYDTILGFSFDLLFYSRLISGAIVFPAYSDWSADDVLRETVRHLGGPAEPPQLQLWLAENFALLHKALGETGRARQALTFAASDLRYGKAVYNLKAPFAECRAALDAAPDVAHDDLDDDQRNEGFAEARVWFVNENENQASAMGTETLGSVALGQSAWRLSALGEKRLKTLQSRFEAALGDRVTLVATRLDDLSKNPASTSYDKALVPPRLLENTSTLSLSSSRLPKLFRPDPNEPWEVTMFRMQDQKFLDDSIPALDGATPRQAARDPNLLPRLKLLLKQRIHGTDQMNLRTGASYNPRWYIEELGVTGLSLAMPPTRPKTETLGLPKTPVPPEIE